MSKSSGGRLDGETTQQLREFTENRFNKSDLIYFDEKVSMLERTALKYYPIIQEVARRMTRHKETQPSEYGTTASRTQRGDDKDRL